MLQVRRCGSDAGAGPFSSLRQLLSRQQGGTTHGPAVVEATVAAVELGDSDGGPALLHLQDGSTAEPLGMYLHSSLLRHCEGPDALLRGRSLLSISYAPFHASAATHQAAAPFPPAGGCSLRIGNCQIRRALKSTGLPPRLLPTQEVAIVCSSVQHAMDVLRPNPAYSLAGVNSTLMLGMWQQHVQRWCIRH